MTPRSRTPHGTESGTSSIPSTVLFTAFSNDRRQRVLAYLAAKPAAIELGDLAEYVVLSEGNSSYDAYERVLTDLYHTHLPHLTDAGLVAYDATRELVDLDVSRDVLAPYLSLAGETDL